jgi:hypothetical protein
VGPEPEGGRWLRGKRRDTGGEPMLTLLEARLRSLVRRHLGESGQAELVVILLLAFLIWLLVTHRRVIVQ